jgi:cytochrome bd-type quinol oxidase subunit 2
MLHGAAGVARPTYDPPVAGDRLWGHRVWLWYAQALLVGVYLLLLVTSRTESGRIFAVMLIVAQVFMACYLYGGWLRTQLRGPEPDLGDPADR